MIIYQRDFIKIKKEVINVRIILASQSPRRRDLLDLMGIKYEVIVSNVDEKLINYMIL